MGVGEVMPRGAKTSVRLEGTPRAVKPLVSFDSFAGMVEEPPVLAAS